MTEVQEHEYTLHDVACPGWCNRTHDVDADELTGIHSTTITHKGLTIALDQQFGKRDGVGVEFDPITAEATYDFHHHEVSGLSAQDLRNEAALFLKAAAAIDRWSQ